MAMNADVFHLSLSSIPYMTKERFCRREPVFKRLNARYIKSCAIFQDVPNTGANYLQTYTQDNYANPARSRTIQESAYGAFQPGPGAGAAFPGFHMERAMLLTPSRPGVAPSVFLA